MFPEVSHMTQPEHEKVKIFQFGLPNATEGNSD